MVRPLLRSWRVLWLALAVAVAPQLSFVHTLTHVAAATSAQSGAQTGAQAGDERQQAPDKACDLCLLLAHLGQALTTQHIWAAPRIDLAAPVCVAFTQSALPAPAHFQARAPPRLPVI